MASIQVQKATSSDNKEVKQPQNGAQATVFNQTVNVMTLVRSIDWSGTPAYPGFPATIQPNKSVMFNHLSDGDFGSSAAVVYDGTNLTGQPCAWVLAWDAPAESDHKPNKDPILKTRIGKGALVDGLYLLPMDTPRRVNAVEDGGNILRIWPHLF